MGSFYALGKIVLLGGIFLVILGFIMMASGKLLNLGRLPGDIFIQKGNFTFYFPVVTTIILSILLTVILNLFLRR